MPTLPVVFALISSLFYNKICGPVDNIAGLREEKTSNIRNAIRDLNASLSHDIDPCEDFYGFVCGPNYKVKNYLPGAVKVGQAIEEYFTHAEELTEAEIKLKNYIKSCKQRAEQDKKEFLRNFNFPNSIGGWPAFDPNWSGDKFNWQLAIAELESYSVPNILYRSFEFHPKSWERVFTLKSKYIDFTTNRATQLREILNKIGLENADNVISDGIKFANEFHELAHFNSSEDTKVVEMNFANLKKEFPEIDWDQQIEVTTGKKLRDNFPVVIQDSGTLKKTIQTIPKMDPKLMANYLFCNFVVSMIEFDTDDFGNKCPNNAIIYFPSVSSGIVLKSFYNSDTRTNLLSLMESLVEGLHTHLSFDESPFVKDTSEYFNKTTRKEYFSFSEENTNKEYKDVTVDSNNFLQNTYLLQKLNSQNGLADKKIEWTFPAVLYKYKNDPLPFVYTSIALEITLYYMDAILYTDKLPASIRECLNQLRDSKNTGDHVVSGSATMKILQKVYIDWVDKNKDIMQSEEMIYQEYGLTNKKVLLIVIMQVGCRQEDISEVRKLMYYNWNLKGFSDAFNCAPGSAMSTKIKCDI